MAHRTTLEEERPARTPKAAKKPAAGGLAKAASDEARERIFDAFRRWGYLEATLDPLGLFEPAKPPRRRAAFTAVRSAPISCTCRNRSAGAGSRSASKRRPAKSIGTKSSSA